MKHQYLKPLIRKPEATFASIVHKMDVYIRQILALLKEVGIDNNAVVMFSSDNKKYTENNCEQDITETNEEETILKRNLYEGGMCTSFIIKCLGITEPSTTTDNYSSFSNIMPTYSNMMDINNFVNIDGISELPALLKQDDKQRPHEYLYSKFSNAGYRQAARIGKWKAIRYDTFRNRSKSFDIFTSKAEARKSNKINEQYPEIISQIELILSEAHSSFTESNNYL